MLSRVQVLSLHTCLLQLGTHTWLWNVSKGSSMYHCIHVYFNLGTHTWLWNVSKGSSMCQCIQSCYLLQLGDVHLAMECYQGFRYVTLDTCLLQLGDAHLAMECYQGFKYVTLDTCLLQLGDAHLAVECYQGFKYVSLDTCLLQLGGAHLAVECWQGFKYVSMHTCLLQLGVHTWLWNVVKGSSMYHCIHVYFNLGSTPGCGMLARVQVCVNAYMFTSTSGAHLAMECYQGFKYVTLDTCLLQLGDAHLAVKC